jgi:hypothetical protein
MSRTIFRNVNLLDGENASRKSATVVVENDRIADTSGGGVQGLPRVIKANQHLRHLL